MRIKTKGGTTRAVKGLGIVNYFWTELTEEQLEQFGQEWPGKTLEDFGFEVEGELEEEEEDD